MEKIFCNENINYVINYQLTEKIVDNNEIFGVEVKLSYENIVEFESVENITKNKDEAIKILNILYENQIAPCHLINILDDLEIILDYEDISIAS